jgi:hypothetical protein
VKASEHKAEFSSTRTGCFAGLARLFGFEGSGAPSAHYAIGGLLALVLLTMLFVAATPAQAGKVPGFGKLGTGTGEGTGQIGASPLGIAVNYTGAGGVSAGDVYVADAANNRIDEFTASGSFVRAFGVDVVRHGGEDDIPGANEVQKVAVKATGGTFTLTFSGQTTSAISFSAPSSGVGSVQEYLEALSTIGAGNITVTGGPGDATASSPYVMTFVGKLAGDDQSQMTSSATNLTGTGKAATVSTVTPGGGNFEICKAASSPQDECKAGTSSSQAGGLAGAKGIGIDPVNGNVFVTADTSHRVNIYSAQGVFEGAFGWKVNATTPEETLQFCTTATGCVAGSTGEAGGQMGSLSPGSSPAVSPLNRHLFVPQPGDRRLDEFGLTLNGSEEVTGVSFIKGFGGGVKPTINEKQQVTLSGATGGTFSLAFESSATGATGTGDLQAGSTEVSTIEPAAGTNFVVGEEISGAGIPSGTTIIGVNFDSLTLSDSATETRREVPLASGLPVSASGETIQNILLALPTIGTGNVAVTGAAGGPWTVEFKAALAGTDVPALVGDGSHLSGTTPSIGITTIQAGANGTSEKFETCTEATGCKAGAGYLNPSEPSKFTAGLGGFPNQTPTSIAIDSSGAIYATGETSTCGGHGCRVQKFNAAVTEVESFAPAQLQPEELAAPNANAPVALTVDPSSDRVVVIVKSAASSYHLLEFSKLGQLLDSSPPGVLGGSGQPKSIAVGVGEQSYLTLGNNVLILGVPPAPSGTAELPEGISFTTATLRGTASPSAPGVEGGFPTAAYFEYSADGVHWTSTNEIEIGTGAGAGSSTSCPAGNPPTCVITQRIADLQPGTTYLVRLVVSNGTRSVSSPVSFETTVGGPTVFGMSPNPVGQTTAKISGFVNPASRPTTYHLEWGTDTTYGIRIPAEYDLTVGSGSQPVKVSANLSGLQPATTYHYRIVASNSAGTTFGQDAEFTTLTTGGLPDHRAFELVSPADKKPAGRVAKIELASIQLYYQAAEDGEAVSYPLFNALEGSPAGGETVFAAGRSPSGWSSTIATPPALAISPSNGGTALATQARSGYVRYMSPEDLRCGVVETHAPLTADTPPADIARGVVNLYRWNRETGEYTLLTPQVPLNPAAEHLNDRFYEVAGANRGCTRVFYRSLEYTFSGSESKLFEWNEGTVRDAGLRPDGSVPTGAGKLIERSAIGIVSPGGLFFFDATSNQGADSGKSAIFVRKAPGEVVDATASSACGGVFQAASKDGSHVVYVGCNNVLYSYDVETGATTDVSPDANPQDTAGPVVEGATAVSNDGSVIYFVARGQLQPGQGRTYIQNHQGVEFANLYRWQGGQVSYVGSVHQREVSLTGAATNQGSVSIAARYWNAQTTPDGDDLLFISEANFDGSNPNEVPAVYLYSAKAEKATCISCSQEQGAYPESRPSETFRFIPTTYSSPGFAQYVPRSLGDDGRVVFASLEALTPGAIEGREVPDTLTYEENVYEWFEGQLSLIAAGHVEPIDMGGPSGRDVFIRSFKQLNSEDFDFASDLYDVRAGGGFPPKPPPPPSCDAVSGECQGAGSSSPASVEPGSASFAGPGNQATPEPAPKKPKKPKKHKKTKKHKKHSKKTKKHKSRTAPKRAATTNRGGVK